MDTVELLQVAGSELIQRDIPDGWDDMLFDGSGDSNSWWMGGYAVWRRAHTGSAAMLRLCTSFARLISLVYLPLMAFFSFALHSACVLPSTFLIMRFPVSG